MSTEAERFSPELSEALAECYEGLDELDLGLSELERGPAKRDVVASLLRTAHTIKGTSGFLGLANLESLAHSMEGLLASLGDGTAAMCPQSYAGLFSTVDAMRATLDNLSATGAGDFDGGGPTSQSIRVDTALLDRLAALAGELAAARDQLLRAVGSNLNGGLLATAGRIDQLTTELQMAVNATRMQRVGSAWSNLPRMVRDLALRCHKQVRFEMEGGEIELERSVLEAVRDPLIHLVRNAVDHGIEAPGVRALAGKSPVGRLSLTALRCGSHVNIEIADDGAGIDARMVHHRALAKGLVRAEQLGRMSQHEITNLVLLPGLSTAESLTSTSGRGVGLDVVRANVERIGGTVDVTSREGSGTSIRMIVPASARPGET